MYIAGATVLDGRLYVIGGSSGNVGLRTCDVYDPETNEWTIISKMHHSKQELTFPLSPTHNLSLSKCPPDYLTHKV